MATGLLVYDCGPLWLYKSGVHASDPSLLLVGTDGKAHLLASPLELPDYREKSSAVVHGYGDARAWCEKAGVPFNWLGMVRFLMLQGRVDALEVNADFGALYVEKLREAGIDVAVAARNPFFEEMAFLRQDEVAKLRAAQDLTGDAIMLARSMLHDAEVRAQGVLYLGGAPLTSERVQGEMNAYLAGLGALDFHGGPIVACGRDGGIPHARGSGPLKAEALIVIDCFPRHANFYWGDCTRTYLKGTPTPWQQKLVETVLRVQAELCAMVKPEAPGAAIQAHAESAFAEAGFATGTADGEDYGFTHSVGHHIGLDLRGPAGRTLTKGGGEVKKGHALTVEPGLYYPRDVNGGTGGCRIEDVVVVTETGCDNLTRLPKADWVVA